VRSGLGNAVEIGKDLVELTGQDRHDVLVLGDAGDVFGE
jgi:hypothetical protein